MSIDYWPICGYGVAVTPGMLDPAKVRRTLGIDIDEGIWAVLERACRELGAPAMLLYSATQEMYAEDIGYLYCPRLLPWDVTQGPWRDLTREQVEEAIRRILGPLLKDNAELFFEEIDEVGCG